MTEARTVDARVPDDVGDGPKGITLAGVLWRILPAAAGSFIEWYEFAIFGYLSIYITGNFFQGSTGAYGTWAAFAITFLFRPIGGALFGWIADHLGRKPAMQLTIMCMLVTTILQGCLPTFHCCGESWGWLGMIVMLVLRTLQGLSAGGELTTAAVYISEVSPKASLGFNTSWIAVCGAFGAYVIAALVVFILESFLNKEQMMDWGWRIPYLSAIFPGALVIIGRHWLTESEEFVESKNQGLPGVEVEEGDSGVSNCEGQSAPLRELLADHWPQLIVGTLGTAGCGALWYVPPVYGVQFIQTYDGLPPSAVTLSEMVVYLIPTVLSPVVGMLVDVWGVGRVYLLAMAAGCVVAPLPLFYWWTHVPASDAVLAVYLGQVILGVLIALTASVYLWAIELFPTRVRVTGVSLAYNLGVGIFGGVGPLISEAGNQALDPRGPVSAPAAYMLVVGILSVLTVLTSRLMGSRGVLKITHIRAHPY
jgi:MHS family proline/betaine transporter-like MFS transporter